MSRLHLLSIRTNDPSTNWRLFPNVVRWAEEAFSAITNQISLANAWKLFVFLAKKHSGRKNLANAGRTFPIDRRELSCLAIGPVDQRKLALRGELGLSAGQIQRAIEQLLSIGAIVRVYHPKGYTHRVVSPGQVHRLPAQYRFASELVVLFRQAQGLYEGRSKSKKKFFSSKERSKASLLDRVPLIGGLRARARVVPEAIKPMELFPDGVRQEAGRGFAGRSVQPQRSPWPVNRPLVAADLGAIEDPGLRGSLERMRAAIAQRNAHVKTAG